MTKGEFAHLAQTGASVAVRATPRAKKPSLSYEDGLFRIAVSAPADEGRATAAVAESLAHALGVAKTRLKLVRGATSREKLFRLE